ncbi:MAG: hypothetical protein LBG78_04775 [Azoarcus sp.]|nr:hypothetical protein [Azoarcus sp.]
MNTYTFRIIGKTPDTLPVKRLAEYLSALSALFGDGVPIYFDRVTKGSAKLKFRVEAGVIENSLKSTPDVVDKINNMLYEDNSKAVFRQEKKGAKPLLSFIGNAANHEFVFTVREAGEFTGRIVRIGGLDETIPVSLVTPEGETIHCTAKHDMAKRLKEYLLEPLDVTLFGQGKWERIGGKWKVREFRIDSAELFNPKSCEEFDEGLRRIREKGSGWDILSDPKAAWLEMRYAE